MRNRMIHVTRFSASWCGPCKALAPMFKELEANITDVKFITVDVEEKPMIAELYQVRSVPTVIIEKDNVVVHKFTGLLSKQKYIEAIEGVKNVS